MFKCFLILSLLFLSACSLVQNNNTSTRSFDSTHTKSTNKSPAVESRGPASTTVEAGPLRVKNRSTEPPLGKFKERVTKKPFGIKITPESSPVQPEKFSGYHTGVDFEIFPEEIDTNVSVQSICDGKVIYKNFVSGYGGVLIQSCVINNEDVTILYGHLNLKSIDLSLNEEIKKNDFIGFLGKAYSQETGYERKHLHLGIRKGAEINLRGYVSSEKELENWIDFMTLNF